MSDKEKMTLIIVGGIVLVLCFFIAEEGDVLAGGVGNALVTFVNDFWQFLVLAGIVAFAAVLFL